MSSAATPGLHTSAHQEGGARNQRRALAGRVRKPYSRADSAKETYKTPAQPSFLRGMKSLVSRLWGATIEPEPAVTENAPKCETSNEANRLGQPESDVHSSMQAKPNATQARKGKATEAPVQQRPAAVTRHTSLMEGVYDIAPYAYDGRMVAISPKIAKVQFVNPNQKPQRLQFRRHTAGRTDSSRMIAQPMSSINNAPINMTRGNVQRLLENMTTLSTPIRDARDEAVRVGQFRTVADQVQPAAKAVPMPLRRLAVSSLVMNKESARASTQAAYGTGMNREEQAMQRTMSLRELSRRQTAAPSLARVLQMQRSRRVAAERLSFASRVNSAMAYADEEINQFDEPAAIQEPIIGSVAEEAGDQEMLEDVEEAEQVAGVRRMRSNESGLKQVKRRRAADGSAVKVSGREEEDEDEDEDDREAREAAEAARQRRLRLAQRRGQGYTRRAMSATGRSVKWQFSARLGLESDSDSDDSDGGNRDQERDAISAKVPRDRIRGGELIGLSLRPPQPAEAKAPQPIEYIPAHLSSFGIDRKPVKVGAREELEKFKAAKAAAVAAAAKPAVLLAPVPAGSPAPATSAVVGSASPKAAELAPAAEKAAPVKAPSFSFGSTAAEPTQAKPAAPASFGFGSKSATPAETPKLSFSFGTPATPAATTATETPRVSFPFGTKTDKPEPATPAATNMFGRLGAKRSADDDAGEEKQAAKEPAASTPLFAFGTTTAAAPAETSAAVAPSLFKTSSFGATQTAEPIKDGAEKPAASTGFSFGKTPSVSGSTGFAFGSGTASSTAMAAPVKTIDLTTTVTVPSFGGVSAKKDDEPAAKQPAFAFGSSASTPPAPAFGATTTAEEKKPSFQFGSGPSPSPATETKSSAFAFGVSKPADTSKPAEATTPAPGGFSFGTSTSSAPKKVAPTSFAFGATTTAAAAADSKPATSSGFAFGSSTEAAEPATTTPTSFAFGSSKPAETAKPTTSGFTFGSSKPAEPTTTTASSFAFGSSKPAEAAKPAASGFGFGSTKAAEPATTTPMSFAFGSSTPASDSKPAATTSSFGFGSSKPAVDTKATTGFSFGNTATVAATPTENKPSVGFAFGGSSNTPAQKPAAGGFTFGSAGGNVASGSVNTGFTFGQNSTSATATPAPAFGGFGAAAPAPGPATSFGQPSTHTSATPTFGQASNVATPFGQANNAVPGFGSSNAAPSFGAPSTPGFGSNGATPAFGANAGFGQSNNVAPTPSFGQPSGGVGFSAQPNPGMPSGGSFLSNNGQPASGFGGGFGSQVNQQTVGGVAQGFGAGQAGSVAGAGGFAMGRSGNGSNASTASNSRRIAQPRTRRKH